MSKWIKLLNQQGMVDLKPHASAVEMHHEIESHGGSPSFSIWIYAAILSLFTAFSLTMVYKISAVLKKTQADQYVLMADYKHQSETLKVLQDELATFKVSSVSVLKKEMDLKQNQLDQLQIENNLLKIKIDDMEFAQQEMISEIESLNQENAKVNLTMEGRKI